MATTSGLKNINMLSEDKYDSVEAPSMDELYAVSGSGTGFPSNKYIELTLGASGSEYEAPANGYFYIDKLTSGSNQKIYFLNTTKAYGITAVPNPSAAIIRLPLKAQKGDIVKIEYAAGGATNAFRFIYAEGE